MDEERFKIIALKALLNENPQCLALEVPFMEGGRRADIVVATSSKELIGYEIKSERDNLDSLEQQLLDYTKVFELTYVILAKKHLSQARSIIPRFVGIIVIDENGIIQKTRKAKKRIRLEKMAIIASIDKKRLVSALKHKQSTIKNDKEIYKLSEKNFSTHELNNILYLQVSEKYIQSFDIFRNEIGSVIHGEDLLNLGIERKLR